MIIIKSKILKNDVLRAFSFTKCCMDEFLVHYFFALERSNNLVGFLNRRLL